MAAVSWLLSHRIPDMLSSASTERAVWPRERFAGFSPFGGSVERRSQGPLTKEDLVGYLASGCKPKEKWRIGTEHEKFGFEVGTLHPMTYEQIAYLLNGIAERFDWDKVLEGDYVIGLKQGKQSISLEPGGQFELTGAPLETLHQTCAEVNSHLYQIVGSDPSRLTSAYLQSRLLDKIKLKGVTPAEKLLELYHGKGGCSVDSVFEELLY